MKQSSFSEELIVSILREAEKGEQAITTVCRAYAISDPISSTDAVFN
jgi:hypothetical protein